MINTRACCGAAPGAAVARARLMMQAAPEAPARVRRERAAARAALSRWAQQAPAARHKASAPEAAKQPAAAADSSSNADHKPDAIPTGSARSGFASDQSADEPA